MESWGDLAKQLWWEMTPQTNYHGTPYTFNKFDDSRFLTGEGFMAHGPGHYSADDIKVGEGYRMPTKRIYNKSIGNFVDINPNEYANKLTGWKLGDYLASFLEHSKDGVMPGDYVTRSTVEKNPLAMEIINNPENYDVRINRGNLYRVNVPNENFMWKEGLPLEQQNDYIKSIVKNNKPFIDYSKYIGNTASQNRHILYKLDLDKHKELKRLADLFLRLDSVYPSDFNGKHRQLMIRMLNKLPFDEQRDLLNYFRGNVDKPNVIPDMQKLYGKNSGIKGIRAKGSIDGPINVTFSGKDIRIANTPWQRFVNRIPTQTLGKMASKLYNTPGVKQTIKFADRVATPLMILEGIGLNQPVGEGSDKPPIYPVNGRLEGYITNEY